MSVSPPNRVSIIRDLGRIRLVSSLLGVAFIYRVKAYIYVYVCIEADLRRSRRNTMCTEWDGGIVSRELPRNAVKAALLMNRVMESKR